MTPKEKAKKLVLKYEKYLFNKFTIDENWVKCVECALIAVDELIKSWNEDLYIDCGASLYWQEVKKEIEKL
jgi:hypothetical protein